MTLGPPDLPPAGDSPQQLYCHCTNQTFTIVIRAGMAAVSCSKCGSAVAVFRASGLAETEIDPARDRLIVNTSGYQGAAQHTYTEACDGFHGSGPCPVAPAQPRLHGAVLSGGELDGQVVPVLADVTDFIYGKPGSGGDGIATGAGWVGGDDLGRKALGQAYRDTGNRDGRGYRIFALTT